MEDKKVMTIQDVAKYTGFSVAYLYKCTCKGLIPYYKPLGKKLFFDREEVDAWLKKIRVPAKNNVSTEKAVKEKLDKEVKEEAKRKANIEKHKSSISNDSKDIFQMLYFLITAGGEEFTELQKDLEKIEKEDLLWYRKKTESLRATLLSATHKLEGFLERRNKGGEVWKEAR